MRRKSLLNKNSASKISIENEEADLVLIDDCDLDQPR